MELTYSSAVTFLTQPSSQIYADGNSVNFLLSSPQFQSDNGNSIICVMYVGSNEQRAELTHLFPYGRDGKKPLFLLTLLPTQISVKQGGEYGPSLYFRSQCPWIKE